MYNTCQLLALESEYIILIRWLNLLFRIVCGLVYYGVAFAAADLGGMKYRDFVLTSISDLAGTFACLCIIKR